MAVKTDVLKTSVVQTGNTEIVPTATLDTMLAAAGASTGVSKVYQHWADGDAQRGTAAEWNNNILSDVKSDYFEGEVIPHVFFYKASNSQPLVNGREYSFNITYNHFQHNTKAGGFVHMTTFDESRQPDSWVVGGKPNSDASFQNGGGMKGVFYTVDANITSVSDVTYTGARSKDGHVTVKFVYTGQTTSAGTAEIYFGLKTAVPDEVKMPGVASTKGSSAWTGGSLQTTVDIGGKGAMSLQLAPSALIVPEPDIAVDKTVVGVYESDGVTLDSDGIADEAGDIIRYNVNVSNVGNVDLTGVSVTDPLTGLAISGLSLLAGESADFSGLYVVTQNDLNTRGGGDGDIDNTATVDSDQTPAESDSEAVRLAYEPGLFIDKTVLGVFEEDGVTPDADGRPDEAGDIIRYAIAVSNTGNIDLTGVSIVDPLTGLSLSGLNLAAGASTQVLAQYTVTQADLNNNGGGDGDIDNTATADSDQTGPQRDTESVLLAARPAVEIDKTVIGVFQSDGVTPDADGVADQAGDIIRYNINVRNTGNVDLTGVSVTDPLTGLAISGLSLLAGTSTNFTESYTVTQADLNSQGGGDGDIDNTATVDSDQTPADSDSESVRLAYAPGILVDKTVVGVFQSDGVTPDADGVADQAGDIIRYNINVRNTGNVDLTGVSVTDPLTGLAISGLSLLAGTSTNFTESYTVTQADLNSQGGGDGDIDNTATVDSDQTPADSDSESVRLAYAPGISIDKAFVAVTGGNGNMSADQAGDILNYTITVNNLGNITLTNVVVTDPLTQLTQTILQLAPGASEIFLASYVLQQSDLDNNGGGDGTIDNIGFADSDQTPVVTDTERVQLMVRPSLAISKTLEGVTGGNGNTLADAIGDILNYNIQVSNAGNVTLTNVSVVDSLTGLNTVVSTLLPGEVRNFATDYALTFTDLDTNGGGDGDIDNIATADSDQTSQVSSEETVQLYTIRALGLDKAYLGASGGNGNIFADAAGDVLNFSIRVYNPGTVTLNNIVITESLTGGTGFISVLMPGESQTLFTSYTLTQADLDSRGGGDNDIDNMATAVSDEAGPVSDSEAAELFINPVLAINKSFLTVTGGNGNAVADAAGDSLNYRIVLSNPGNLTLTGVTLTDSLTGLSVSNITLAPNTVQQYFSSYVLTQADLDSNGDGDGYINNLATATSDQTDPAIDEEVVPLLRLAGASFDEVLVGVNGGNGNALADAAGDVITFRYTVVNDGNVTLNNGTITDPLTGLAVSNLDMLPGETRVFEASYVLTQADLDSNGGGDGRIESNAVLDFDEITPETDGETVTVVFAPRIDLVKSVSVDEGLTWFDANAPTGPELLQSAGHGPWFKFDVSNNGNITLPDVFLFDSLHDLNGPAPGVTYNIGTMAPGSSVSVIYADAPFAEGQQGNTATVGLAGLPLTTDVDIAYYLGVAA